MLSLLLIPKTWPQFVILILCNWFMAFPTMAGRIPVAWFVGIQYNLVLAMLLYTYRDRLRDKVSYLMLAFKKSTPPIDIVAVLQFNNK